jgi:hypothetical protein
MHVDGWTDGQTDTHVTKSVVAFRNSANLPKDEQYCAHTAQQSSNFRWTAYLFVQYSLSDRQFPAARSVAGLLWPQSLSLPLYHVITTSKRVIHIVTTVMWGTSAWLVGCFALLHDECADFTAQWPVITRLRNKHSCWMGLVFQADTALLFHMFIVLLTPVTSCSDVRPWPDTPPAT